MMKADRLSIFEENKICKQFRMENGEITDKLPFSFENKNLELVDNLLPEWGNRLKNATSWDILPKNLLNYNSFIEEHVWFPITMVSSEPKKVKPFSKINRKLKI
jgi:adenylosuccinate synthase